ncbi:MAG: hypothetical protein IJD39_07985 [Clostridia bacterium]|nr:hypothetical protein [Clostridia bacterium]
MKDGMERKKANKKPEQQLNRRFILFSVAVMLLFGVLIYGLFDLQIVNGAEYAIETGSSSIKRIAIKGSRGMITDVNSVVLAMSEKAYNITFYRESTDWDYPTKMLLEAIEIIEKHGGEISLTAPLRRNEETNAWEFNLGSGISESAYATRLSYFYSNNYLTKNITADKAFATLRQRYGFTDLGDGKYVLQLDRNGASVVPDVNNPNTNAVVESIYVDESVVMKVLAINTTMQDNAFNSLPIAIAENVTYETVSEIEGRSMSMPWVGVTMGEKRVYPKSTLAASIIGYTGKIQDANYYYSDLKPAGYSMNDHIGQMGVESSMENWLTANITERQGERIVETDPLGRITRELSYTAPQDGNTVKLTINAEYQAVAEQFLASNVEEARKEQEKRMQDSKWLETQKDKITFRNWDKYPLNLADTGVLLVMDVRNGSMLAMAQYPNYDLNAMIEGGDAAREIIMDERLLTMNYAVQTRAEPGSIFKMVTGLAALTNGVLTPTEEISDAGRFMKYTNNRLDAPKCWTNSPKDHAKQNISAGLTNSCNYFFYELGSRLYGSGGTERLYKYAAQMGLTSKTGIDIPGELRSIVGNQTNLYDQTVALKEQVTDTPIIVANSIKTHIRNYAASYGITYDDARLDKCIKLLMDMAINSSSDDWVANARPIFMQELNMTRTMVMQAALMTDLWTYLNDIKWGGSQEIQMGIGQSITLLTPIAVVRYVGALNDEAVVWNPSIIDSIVSPEGEILSQRKATEFNTLKTAREFMPYILKGMEGVVDDGGTAKKYFDGWKYEPEEVMAGKTGTSQVTIGGVRLDLENNAWFVALTPKDDPEIAVVCHIPNGYAGAQAVRAVRDFIGFYLDEKAKEAEVVALPGGNSLAP